MKNVTIIYNPESGSGMSKQHALQLEDLFLKKGDESPQSITLKEIRSGMHAREIAKFASEQHCDLVVAIGGDGTVNQVAGGIVDGGSFSTLGIIPGGTVNNFARALKVPLDPRQAMENLWNGQVRSVDIGKVNDGYVISSMTLGLLADVAEDVSTEEKKKFGPLAFLKNLFRVLRKNKSYRLHLTFDGGTMFQKVKIMLVTMTNSVGGFDYFNPEASPDDGYFHVYLLSGLSLWKTILRMPYLLEGRFADIPEVSYFKTRCLMLASRKAKKIQIRIDGDPSYKLAINMKVIHKGLKVKVPYDSI